jgi:DnaJ-class molecular chaperone
MTNYYDLLGVSSNASEEEIKKKYRALSLKYHPDRNNGDKECTEKFQKISEAYETLQDSNKRQQYNMELQFGGGSEGDIGNMNDIFNMFFGGGGGPPMNSGFGPGVRVFHSGSSNGFPGGMEHIFEQMQKPPPIIKNVSISLCDVYNGSNISIQISRKDFFNDGLVEEATIHINIPKGIDNGEVMILREQGHINQNLKGDVKIMFSVSNMNGFIRNGMNLIFKKTISLKDALCGFSFEIEHLNGKTLHIQNTQSPTVISPNYRKNIPGYGMIKEDNVGIMTIEFSIDFPNSITVEQQNLLKDIL